MIVWPVLKQQVNCSNQLKDNSQVPYIVLARRTNHFRFKAVVLLSNTATTFISDQKLQAFLKFYIPQLNLNHISLSFFAMPVLKCF